MLAEDKMDKDKEGWNSSLYTNSVNEAKLLGNKIKSMKPASNICPGNQTRDLKLAPGSQNANTISCLFNFVEIFRYKHFEVQKRTGKAFDKLITNRPFC